MSSNPLDLIINCINSRESFCFNSGAGSGKTYNLVKTLEYINDVYGRKLLKNNQKVMVITYTNAATNEIIKRIGDNKICDISTIHTRLWEIVKGFQNDLLLLHLNKIKEEIIELEDYFLTNIFSNDESLKQTIINNKEFINEFYKYSTLDAAGFRIKFSKYTAPEQISNVASFKSFVNKYQRYNKLLVAKEGIEQKKKGFKKVEYDPFDNNDKLYKMKFSHNTLIEYTNSLIEKSKTIKRIIIDKYPFVLIDEYQDTSSLVVKAFGSLLPATTIGFYGDNCQNIYDDGVGNKLFDIIPNLVIINNEINRRSNAKIVDLGNIIRNDSFFKQKPFNTDKGTVQTYFSKNDNDTVVNSFINKVINEFSESKVVFFLLKNEQVASKNGFGTFYSLICNTDYYKNHFEQKTTELLSDDETKLGTVPHNLYQIMKLINSVNKNTNQVSEYIPENVLNKINLYKLKQIIDKLRSACDCKTLKEIIYNFSTLIDANDIFKDIIKWKISDGDYLNNPDAYENFLLDNLYGEIEESRMPNVKENINHLLSLDISELKNWFSYILRIDNKPVNFYTFHGTKGLEFDNVGVIITNAFNNKKNYYHSFFKELSCEQKSDDFQAKKNLLYVAVTRAKKNLRILYIDSDFKDIKDNFLSVFGNASEFEKNIF